MSIHRVTPRESLSPREARHTSRATEATCPCCKDGQIREVLDDWGPVCCLHDCPECSGAGEISLERYRELKRLHAAEMD